MLEGSVGTNAKHLEPLAASTADFISDLRARDVRCWAEGERLRLSAPREALTPELREELSRRKEEILSYLRAAEARGLAAPRVTPVPRNGGLPLSFAQERL